MSVLFLQVKKKRCVDAVNQQQWYDTELNCIFHVEWEKERGTRYEYYLWHVAYRASAVPWNRKPESSGFRYLWGWQKCIAKNQSNIMTTPAQVGATKAPYCTIPKALTKYFAYAISSFYPLHSFRVHCRPVCFRALRQGANVTSYRSRGTAAFDCHSVPRSDNMDPLNGNKPQRYPFGTNSVQSLLVATRSLHSFILPEINLECLLLHEPPELFRDPGMSLTAELGRWQLIKSKDCFTSSEAQKCLLIMSSTWHFPSPRQGLSHRRIWPPLIFSSVSSARDVAIHSKARRCGALRLRSGGLPDKALAVLNEGLHTPDNLGVPDMTMGTTTTSRPRYQRRDYVSFWVLSDCTIDYHISIALLFLPDLIRLFIYIHL